MTRSELVELLARKNGLKDEDVGAAVKTLLDHMAQALSAWGRIEIRWFGSFSMHRRPPRTGRNPRTGEAVEVKARRWPHFKPGKELRGRVDASRP
jgi:integration host factor subunit beta